MCSLCGILGADVHWSEMRADALPDEVDSSTTTMEEAAARVGDKMRDRAQRVKLFNLLLGQLGLKLQDWEGSNYLLQDKKGNQAIAPDLAGLWLSAEKMLGRPIDPLDPSYLESLRSIAQAH